jgi:hypothetical protein
LLSKYSQLWAMKQNSKFFAMEGEIVDKEAMILSHINEIDQQLSRLTRKGYVEGWTSYTELQKAKSIALLALATLTDDKETK